MSGVSLIDTAGGRGLRAPRELERHSTLLCPNRPTSGTESPHPRRIGDIPNRHSEATDGYCGFRTVQVEGLWTAPSRRAPTLPPLKRLSVRCWNPLRQIGRYEVD